MGLSAFFEVQTSKLLSFFRNIFNSASCIRPIHSLAAFILLYNMFYLIDWNQEIGSDQKCTSGSTTFGKHATL